MSNIVVIVAQSYCIVLYCCIIGTAAAAVERKGMEKADIPIRSYSCLGFTLSCLQ